MAGLRGERPPFRSQGRLGNAHPPELARGRKPSLSQTLALVKTGSAGPCATRTLAQAEAPLLAHWSE